MILIGCVTVDDLRKVKRDEWSVKKVRDVMIAREKLVTVKESDPAMSVLVLMNKNRIGRIFVMDENGKKMTGIVTRSDIMKTVRMEEGIFGGGRADTGALHAISVEVGMLFELEVPTNTGEEWTASYSKDEFVLVSEKILQMSDGSQSKQFTFQSSQKGRFMIKLNPSYSQAQTLSQPPGKGRRQIIAYTVIVN